MAQKVWRTIPVNTAKPSAVLYWIKKFFDEVQTTFPNRISIIDSYAGTNGTWDSETSVGTKAYIVIQGYHAWADGKKWQCLIGACNNTNDTLGDYTNQLPIGLWVMLSANGGWNAEGAKIFSYDPTTEFLEIRGGTVGGTWYASTLEILAVVDKIVNGTKVGEAFILVGSHNSSTKNIGLYIGNYYDADPNFAKPACLFVGAPSRINYGSTWGTTNPRNGRFLKSDLSLFIPGRLFNSVADLQSGQLLTRSGNNPFLLPIHAYTFDNSVERTAGWLCEVWFGDYSLTDGLEDSTNKRVIFNTMAWPSGDKQ
jgi:hypothetical protein